MTRNRLTALLGSMAALSLGMAAAQDGEDSDEPVRCVSMNSIRSTKVLDDQRVLFVQSKDKVFLNRLDRECLGLFRNGTFTYKVQSGARHARLCDTDSITVLETTGRGLNCGLGLFEPLSQAEVDTLIAGPRSPPITSAPVELPQEEQTPPPAPAPPPQ
jgi:hypothetical protein